ncbi:hypothetical protein ACSJL3_001186 [Serratia nevei]|uniref:hypothetical protein n=1 Tax=Serratia nevei TaxID=2703794 RepID=UPI003F6C558A
MQEQVREAIQCWARRPTWYTSHPSDEKELRKAVSNLKKLPFHPTVAELAEAILFFTEKAPTLLGTPSDIPAESYAFAQKIHKRL